MPPYTGDSLADAAFDVTNGGLSMTKGAEKHGVPKWALSHRLNGRLSRTEVVHPQRLLSDGQEAHVFQWILRQETLGNAPSHSAVREIAVSMAKVNGHTARLGANWMDGFKKRHPEIHTKVGKRQEACRFKAFTPKAVSCYFEHRESFGWVKPKNIFNIDEGGIMAGFGIDSLVLGSLESIKSFLKSPQGRGWTSFIERISAAGVDLDPGIIFKGKNLQLQWFIEEFREVANWHGKHFLSISSDGG
ncbi:hypothetical protein E0Z10_g5317 [Xylaria hypoxylon]|uniref:HTH CENPB-type domain-containing protein n=1 Tax=Xylaria hypoxylon TaxID=37992 RepID=A0A4Z0Z1G3_9PEZI|nr:hypothetical protein E0Z10_g5317 [Xylaria hypoxylon]